MTSTFSINRQGGFTVFELVMVIVITGVLGMIALPRLQLGNQFEQRMQADNLVGLLRLAQLRAMNDPTALDPIAAGGGQAEKIARQCGIIAITSTGISLAKNCANTGTATLITAADIALASSQGLYIGQQELNISVNSPFSLPLRLAFGEPGSASAGGGARLLAEASWLGKPFVGDDRLSQTLTLSLGNKTLVIEPEGYIYAH